MYRRIEDRRNAVREWKKKNKDKVREQRRRYRAKHPDYLRNWRKENKEKVRKYNLKERQKRANYTKGDGDAKKDFTLLVYASRRA